jgi:hypothetical protein
VPPESNGTCSHSLLRKLAGTYVLLSLFHLDVSLRNCDTPYAADFVEAYIQLVGIW